MNATTVPRDEPIVAVENAGYRLAYLVLSFGLLIAVAYRGFALRESTWDLLALVLLGGLVSAVHRGRHGAFPLRQAAASLAAVAIALVIGAALAFMIR
jgi:hypothetical protein